MDGLNTGSLNELERFVLNFHKGERTFIELKDNARLWVHDLLHALLEQPSNSKGEETIAIYQAVLLRDTQVTPRRKPLGDGGEDITLSDVKEKVMPGVRNHIERIARRFGFKPSETLKLKADEIEEIFGKAKVLSALIKSNLGAYLGELSIDRIKDLPLNDCLEMVGTMNFVYSNIANRERTARPARILAD